MNDRNVLVGKIHPGIDFGNSAIVPLGDLAQIDVGQHVGSELHLAVHAGNVVRRNHGSKNGRNVQYLDLGLGNLLIAHGAVAGAKIHRARLHLTNPAAAANRLIVDLNIGMQIVVLVKPLGVDRVRKGCAGSVQSRLRQRASGKHSDAEEHPERANHVVSS